MLTFRWVVVVRRGHGGCGGEAMGRERSADELGVFSSNTCQHFKVLEELSLSPGTRRQPMAPALNAKRLRRRCWVIGTEASEIGWTALGLERLQPEKNDTNLTALMAPRGDQNWK